MIRHTASAVFLMRDGFTGVTLTDGSATRCTLDGRPLRRPLWKSDGYLVLTDLEPGEHILRISRSGFLDEVVTLQVADGRTIEDTVSLKPGVGYRFPAETVRVSLTLHSGEGPVSGERIWLGVLPRMQFKLAQEKAEAGDREAHLFYEANPALLPVPGHFLMIDEERPELVYLRTYRNETGEFYPALTCEHGRGTLLVPMQSYEADQEGKLCILFREPGTLIGFCGGTVYDTQLHSGENILEWDLEG